jgi:hypothetical protein
MKLAIVEAWHDALNSGDVEGVVASTSADVEIVGPRGTARGHDVLRQWTVGAGAELHPVRWFCGDGGRVVLEQVATWPSPAERTDPLAVATSFTVKHGWITRIARRGDLDSALADGGVTWGDEVPAPRR